jgi:hypothetical protein
VEYLEQAYLTATDTQAQAAVEEEVGLHSLTHSH